MGRWVGRAVARLGRGTDGAERRGFAAAGDGLGRWVIAAGRRVRRVQGGRVSVYALSLFVWGLAMGVVAVVVWG